MQLRQLGQQLQQPDPQGSVLADSSQGAVAWPLKLWRKLAGPALQRRLVAAGLLTELTAAEVGLMLCSVQAEPESFQQLQQQARGELKEWPGQLGSGVAHPHVEKLLPRRGHA